MCLTSTRKWRVLCWNLRGLNSEARQRAVRSKIEESNCSIISLQETKCASFDHKFIRKFCPKRFDCFAFVPSTGASGGILVVWNSAIFTGTLRQVKKIGLVINFSSMHTNVSWTLVNVYGPCKGIERDNFVSWQYNLHVSPSQSWLLLGDFNFIRTSRNINKPRG
jgi:exonuclease III